ncbi:MAG: hypothetical protein ACR2FI_06355 [Burkholderiales bacterium]
MESESFGKKLSEECVKALGVADLRMVLAIDGSGNITGFFPPNVETWVERHPIEIRDGRILAQGVVSVVAYEGSPPRVTCCGTIGGSYRCWGG